MHKNRPWPVGNAHSTHTILTHHSHYTHTAPALHSAKLRLMHSSPPSLSSPSLQLPLFLCTQLFCLWFCSATGFFNMLSPFHAPSAAPYSELLPSAVNSNWRRVVAGIRRLPWAAFAVVVVVVAVCLWPRLEVLFICLVICIICSIIYGMQAFLLLFFFLSIHWSALLLLLLQLLLPVCCCHSSESDVSDWNDLIN